MPVKSKEAMLALETEFQRRFDRLSAMLKSRPLKDSREGVQGRGCWRKTDGMLATTGTTLDLRLAVEDFKAILAEIKGLK